MLFREGSLLNRLQSAFSKRAYTEQSIPAPFLGAFGGLIGMPHQYKPMESLEAYGDNPWLYAGINVIAQEFARVKLRLFKEYSDGEKEEFPMHQALSTLNRPQSINGGRAILTHVQLKYLTALYYMLNGEAFWLVDSRLSENVGSAPTSLFPLLPGFMLEKLDTNFSIEKYIYRSAGRQYELDPMDVIHFKLPDPKNWYRGHSPIKSLRWAIESHKEADIFNTQRFQNNAVPGGILSSDQAIAEENRKRLRDEWVQNYSGSKNALKTAVMPYGIKYQQIQSTNAELQYAELKERTRDEILANIRVGMEMLGKTEGQSRANADAANYVFQRFTILPLVEFFVDVLNNDYLAAFPGTVAKDGSWELKFGFDEFVPDDMETKRANVQILSDIGAISPNEARETFNLEPSDNPVMDETFINFNKVPLADKVNDKEVEDEIQGEEGETEEVSEDRKRRAPGDDVPEDADEVFDEEEETHSLAKMMTPFLIAGFRRGIQIGNESGPQVAEDTVFTVKAKKTLTDRSLQYATEAIGTTKDELQGVLDQAQEEGWGVRETAKAIDDLYGEPLGYKSLRIARTEMTGSINDGLSQTLDEQGYTEKTWSTVMDGRERGAKETDEFSHADANGESVPLSEPFTKTGEELMYPGDANGSAGNIILCRCTLIGGGPNVDRQAKHNDIFIRAHSTLENDFVSALNKHFQKQRDRILSKFPSR